MMENTYWNETGKYQAFCDAALDKAPGYGYTDNDYLNALISMSHVYYDVYNNGGGNIEDCFQKDFRTYVKPLVPDVDIADFIYGNLPKVERAMDSLLEYLQDKPLDCTIHSCWWSYDQKILSFVEPVDKGGINWSAVTFGRDNEMRQWALDQISFCHVRNVTEEVRKTNEILAPQVPPKSTELPPICYSTLSSTGEIIIISNGEQGYYPSKWANNSPEENKAIVDELNKKMGLTQAQVKAMEFGSMFGWDKPGANPEVYMKKTLQAQIDAAEAKTNGLTTDVPAKTIADVAR